ncbi:bis-aminopropyl spermidine synthase family protein [Paenibacillus larvae]
MLLKQLFPDGILTQTEIHVTDIDDRFLDYIRMLAEQEGLPVRCHHHDLREPFFGEIDNRYDCFFTDPPYTMEGMSLFVSKGISALKHEKGLPVFLSYSHKSPDFMLAMQREFVQMGLMTKEVIPHFNKYEGAEIIANQGQMIILNTTDLTKPSISDSFREAIYTGEKKRTLRLYECKTCNQQVAVGAAGEVPTIEALQNRGCSNCKQDIFELVVRKIG